MAKKIALKLRSSLFSIDNKIVFLIRIKKSMHFVTFVSKSLSKSKDLTWKGYKKLHQFAKAKMKIAK